MMHAHPGDLWYSLWCWIILGAAVVWLLSFGWRVRMEARQTRQPVTSTASFTSVAFRAAVVMSLAVALTAGILIGPYIDKRAGKIGTVFALEGALCLGLALARIVIANRLLRQGRELPMAALIFSELAGWSRRRLGRWWAAEIGLLAAICLGILLLTGVTGLMGLLLVVALQLGERLYITMAFDRGLDWPDRTAQRQDADRSREVQALPEFQMLRARFQWLELWSAIFAIAGLLVPFLTVTTLFDRYDARNAWLVGMMIAAMGGWPTAFVVLVTRLQGRACWAEFVMYCRLRNGDRGTRVLAWASFGSLLVTAVCTIGLLTSLLW